MDLYLPNFARGFQGTPTLILFRAPTDYARTENDYRVMVDMRKFDFFVEFAEDGLVRKAYLLHDPEYDVGAGSYS